MLCISGRRCWEANSNLASDAEYPSLINQLWYLYIWQLPLIHRLVMCIPYMSDSYYKEKGTQENKQKCNSSAMTMRRSFLSPLFIKSMSLTRLHFSYWRGPVHICISSSCDANGLKAQYPAGRLTSEVHGHLTACVAMHDLLLLSQCACMDSCKCAYQSGRSSHLQSILP